MRIPTPAVALVLLSFSFAGFGKSYQADQYNVLLQLDSAGGLTVTETATFHFEGGPFTYVFRDISATGTDGISEVRAWMGGQLCRLGTGPGEVEVKGRSPVAVRWHFAPMVDGTQTFTVQYRAAGTVRNAGNSQELIWRALPPDRKYRIAASDIAIEYPAAVSPSMVGLRSAGQVFEIGPGRAFTRLVDSPARTPVVVDARFPAGSFTGPEPAWTRAVERRDEDMRSGARIGAVVAAFYLALVCLWMFGVRASAKLESDGPQGGEMVMSPPSTLPPALAASLIGQAGLVLGTLLGLARRHRLASKKRIARAGVPGNTRLCGAMLPPNSPIRRRRCCMAYSGSRRNGAAAALSAVVSSGLRSSGPDRVDWRGIVRPCPPAGAKQAVVGRWPGIRRRTGTPPDRNCGPGEGVHGAGCRLFGSGCLDDPGGSAGADSGRDAAGLDTGRSSGGLPLEEFQQVPGASGTRPHGVAGSGRPGSIPALRRGIRLDDTTAETPGETGRGIAAGVVAGNAERSRGTNADSMVAFTSVCDACRYSGGGAACGAAASGGGACGDG